MPAPPRRAVAPPAAGRSAVLRAAGPLLAILALAPLARPHPVAAQSSPNADQILNSLMPRPGMAGGTRGIRPAGAPPPVVVPAEAAPGGGTPATRSALRVPPPRTPGPARLSREADAAPSVSLSVQFASNSAEVTSEAARTLDQLGIALSSPRLAGDRFRIEGHTDTVGGTETNQALSARRADAVATYLADHFHVARERLEAAGLGEDGLVVQTGQGVPERRNRRVAVINLGA